MSLDPRPSLSDSNRVRLWNLHKGICHICGEKIDGVREKWDVEHVIPRALIGKLADTDDNMRPAHKACHAKKTAADLGNIAKAKRREARHIGAHRPKSVIPGSRSSRFKRKLDGTVVDRITGERI